MALAVNRLYRLINCWRCLVKKISVIIVLILAVSLLTACVIYSNSSEEENSQEPAPQNENLTDTGIYQGQVDSNSIEIAISGVPGENAVKVFILSELLKEKFGELGLTGGETIRFQYFINESNQNVIMEIEGLNEQGEEE